MADAASVVVVGMAAATVKVFVADDDVTNLLLPGKEDSELTAIDAKSLPGGKGTASKPYATSTRSAGSPGAGDVVRMVEGEDGRRPEAAADSGISFQTAVSEFEKKLILNALEKTSWVKNRAADLLKIKRTTLVEKIKRYSLEKPDSDS